MNLQLAKKYYLDEDNNCAETVLHIANEQFGFHIDDEDFKLIGAFGGGMGSGLTCGVLCGSLAALGRLAIHGSAHKTVGFRELCREYVELFQKAFGDTDCAALKPIWFKEDGSRCLEIVEKNSELFSRFIDEHESMINKK